RSTMSSDAVARSIGWRWYDGPTLGGGHLSDVVCPICAGLTTAADSERWNVVCLTCDFNYEEDRHPDDVDDALTEPKDAVSVGRDHECEPESRIISPSDEKDELHDFDRNEKLREKVGTPEP